MSENVIFRHNGHNLTLFSESQKDNLPEASSIVVEAMQLSAHDIQPGKTVNLKAQLHGEDVGHIFVVAYLAKDNYAYGPVYQEYCIAPHTKTVRGVAYPQWQSDIQLSHEFNIGLPLLVNHGQESFGFAIPQRYGADPEEQQYQIPGWYRAFGKEDRQRARLSFEAEGKLLSIVASSGTKGAAPVRKVSPKTGDTFTPLARRFRPSPGLISTTADDFVLADEIALSWEVRRTSQTAMEGDYYVGILVEDLNGHHYRQVERISIDAMAA